jgi:hypothetical protein
VGRTTFIAVRTAELKHRNRGSLSVNVWHDFQGVKLGGIRTAEDSTIQSNLGTKFECHTTVFLL